MAAPVWLLSVDLQAKTAVFTSGLADAAKKARGSFQDIKSSAQDMSEGSSRGFGDIRHSLGLLDNSIRGQHGAAMADAIRLTAQFVDISGALPFAAMAGGFILVGGLIVEAAKKLQEFRQQAEKTAESEQKFGTSINDVFNGLDRKILEAGIRSDELSKDHLDALHKQIQLIDMESLSDLVHSFGEVSKAADEAFAQLKSNWYSMGIGSAGAQHSLEQFKAQYDLLLSAGKDKEAANLLEEKIKREQHFLDIQNRANLAKTFINSGADANNSNYNAYEAAKLELQKAGIGFTEKEVQAQEALVRALDAQATVQAKVNTLKGIQKGNAGQSTANTMGAEAFSQLRAQWDADRKAQEDAARLSEDAHNKAVTQLEESEKQKIEVTDKASAERLAAIDAALKQEEMYGLQETSFYRDLLNQRLTTAKAMADEEEKQKAEAGKEAAANAEKMAELSLAAQKEHQQVIDSARHMTDKQRSAEALQAANEELSIKMTAMSQEAAALDKSDKDYENKLRAIQDKQKQLVQQHENEITAIKDKAEIERNARILSAETKMQDDIARGLANVITRHQSFGAMLASISDQVAAGMIQNAIKSIMADDMTKEHDAAAAARKAYLAGMHFPFPANIVMGPALAAMAFASVMAFEGGGIVPGVTKGDTVPAMLTPGESVLPKSLTEGLTRAANSGNMGGGSTYHVHVRPTYHVNTIDGDGMQAALDKHSNILQSHFESTLRRMNK